MKVCKRIMSIPPYMFTKLDKLKSEVIKRGQGVIDISIGDPDLPTPEFIVTSLKESSGDWWNHRYPPYEGTCEFRSAVAYYYKRRFNVDLDIDNEIIALIGSKEGIANLSLALIDEGDTAIVPDPAYPIYKTSVCLAGGESYIMPLIEENGFLPDLERITRRVAEKAKLMYINYPNNPTGAVCDMDLLKSIIEFAGKNDIVICNDTAYNEIVFDNNKPVSIFNIDGAKEIGVEIGTLSKSYNMTGWRLGYAVGNREVLKSLMIVKTNTDSGQFGAIQHAGSTALNHGDSYILHIKKLYENRRNTAVTLLRKIGMDPVVPKGSFYVWFKVPEGYTSSNFARKLLDECSVIVTPGNAFGVYGEGYCRIALTVDENELEKAVSRIKQSIS